MISALCAAREVNQHFNLQSHKGDPPSPEIHCLGSIELANIIGVLQIAQHKRQGWELIIMPTL